MRMEGHGEVAEGDVSVPVRERSVCVTRFDHIVTLVVTSD